MRTAIDVLADATSQGLELVVLDGGLVVRPQSKLSPGLRSELKARKPAILAILLANPPLVEPGGDAVCRYHCGEITGLCVRCQRAYRAHPQAPLHALAHSSCHYCGEDFWTMWQRPGSLPTCRACREGS